MSVKSNDVSFDLFYHGDLSQACVCVSVNKKELVDQKTLRMQVIRYEGLKFKLMIHISHKL